MNAAQRHAIIARREELKGTIVSLENRQHELTKLLVEIDKRKASLWKEIAELDVPDRSLPEGFTVIASAVEFEKGDIALTFDLRSEDGMTALRRFMVGEEDGEGQESNDQRDQHPAG